MTHTFSKVYLHIILSTRNRQPWLRGDINNKLYKFVGGICKGEECSPLGIGGSLDHIHILCQLDKNISILGLIEEIKIGSVKWLRTHPQLQDFNWQQGYNVFSVGEDDLLRIQHFIQTQKEHHLSLSFAEELKKLLSESEPDLSEPSWLQVNK